MALFSALDDDERLFGAFIEFESFDFAKLEAWIFRLENALEISPTLGALHAFRGIAGRQLHDGGRMLRVGDIQREKIDNRFENCADIDTGATDKPLRHR